MPGRALWEAARAWTRQSSSVVERDLECLDADRRRETFGFSREVHDYAVRIGELGVHGAFDRGPLRRHGRSRKVRYCSSINFAVADTLWHPSRGARPEIETIRSSIEGQRAFAGVAERRGATIPDFGVAARGLGEGLVVAQPC